MERNERRFSIKGVAFNFYNNTPWWVLLMLSVFFMVMGKILGK